jgi:1,4-alpha-glucan branching enzyme
MPLKLGKRPKIKTKKVGFEFLAPEAQEVALAGDFNDWDINSLPMKKTRKGNWKIRIALSPGKHEYLFWVDGFWQGDPKAEDRVPNPFGGWNSLKIVV